MTASRRAFLTGAAALSAAVLTPEVVRAAAAMREASHWSLAVADLEADIAPRTLRVVHGRAPVGLEGTLFRNGPAKFRRPGGNATHWFDGDGLMRAFDIRDGQATLRARFADTPKRRFETELDAVVTPGFGTPGDSRARLGSNEDANAANTAVMIAGDRIWALWEAGSPLAMNPDTLASEGFVTLRPDLKSMPFQAHPRTGPDGDIWNIGLAGDQAIVWRLDPTGSLKAADVVALPRASYMHDFTATARHLILVLQPWVIAREGMPYSARFDWKPEMGTQVLVLDKADLNRHRIFELPAFSHFHLGDAWEETDGTIRFDVAAHQDAGFSISGGAAILQGRNAEGEPPKLAFITLHADGRAEMRTTTVTAEFPKGDPRRAGLPRSLTVHVAGETADRPLPRGLALQDWSTGRSHAYDFGEGHVVEEMVFVPKPGKTAERDAWLVGPSINLAEGVTELHAFDAARVGDGPVVTWRADVAVPAGFHGAFRAG